VEANLHSEQARRLATLRSYEILDTPREVDFDDITLVLSAICEAPISVINLIDEGRQWFKAEIGLGVREMPLPASICANAILQRGLFIVRDTLQDPRFCDNPLVTGDPHLRFYAGALLETSEGLPLGTVCVLDYRPRDLDEKQKALLRLMASQVMKLLELRRANILEGAARARAELLVKENEMLARESDHRVMNSLQLVSSVLGLQTRIAVGEEAKAQLEGARHRVQAIATVHQQLHLTGSLEDIEINGFLNRLCESLKQTAPSMIQAISVKADQAKVRSDLASTLGLIVAELTTNSFKHAYPSGHAGSVVVTFAHDKTKWLLTVSDDGTGMPGDFDIAKSKGVGMRVVAALVRRLDATLSIDSRPTGTVFSVSCEAREIAA